jgi:hypothetical protein
MVSVGPAISFAYTGRSMGCRRERLWTFHEPGLRNRGSRSPDRPAVVRLHLKPGQKGTKRLLEQYGDRLVCVRYRYDASRRKRFKTVELIVAERDWQSPRPCLAPDRPISLRIAFAEVDLRRRVKQAGGRWNPDERVWQLPHDRAVALGLGGRIVATTASSSGCRTPTGEHLHADA